MVTYNLDDDVDIAYSKVWVGIQSNYGALGPKPDKLALRGGMWGQENYVDAFARSLLRREGIELAHNTQHTINLEEPGLPPLRIDIRGGALDVSPNPRLRVVITLQEQEVAKPDVLLRVTQWKHTRWHEPHAAAPVDVFLRKPGENGAHAISARCETCDEVLVPETFKNAQEIDPDLPK